MGYDINTDDNMSAEVVAQSTHMDATRQQPPGMDATPLSLFNANMGAYGGFPDIDTKIDLLSPPVSGNYNRSNNHWTNKLQSISHEVMGSDAMIFVF